MAQGSVRAGRENGENTSKSSVGLARFKHNTQENKKIKNRELIWGLFPWSLQGQVDS